MSCHNSQVAVWTFTKSLQQFHSFLFSYSVIDFLLMHNTISSVSYCTDDLTFEPWILWHTEKFCRLNDKLKNKPKSSAIHHYALQLVWGVCVDMLYLAFAKCGSVLYDQTSSVERTCSRTFVDFSKLNHTEMLFIERGGFLLQPFQTAILVQSFSNCTVINFNV